MILTQDQIREAHSKKEIQHSGSLRGNCILLSAGRVFQRFSPGEKPIDPTRKESVTSYYEAHQEFETVHVAPKELILVAGDSPISIGPRYMGFMSGLSHFARLGISLQLNSFIIEPGFSGHLTFEVFNHGLRPVIIRTGMPIAKIALAELDETATTKASTDHIYGPEHSLGSRYYEEFGQESEFQNSRP